jgi:TniQ
MSRIPAAARLVVRGTPRIGESLRGFVLRIAEANGYRGIAPLLQLARLPPTFVSRTSPLQNLAELFDGLVDVDDLRTRSHWPAIERAFLQNAAISPVDLNLAHPKICPMCLKESGFARLVWDLRVVITCWRHGCYLLDHCSVCRRRLTWGRKALTACTCGADFMIQRTEDAPISVLEFSRRLETMLESPDVGLDLFPTPVRTVSALCRVVWLFGIHSSETSHGQAWAISKPALVQATEIVERGIAVLMGWHGSIEQPINEICAAGSDQHQAQLKLHHALGRVRSAFHDEQLQGIFEDIRRYLATSLYGLDVGALSSRRDHTMQSEVFGVNRAARQLSLSPLMIPLLVRTGCLASSKDGRFGHLARCNIRSSSIREFKYNYVSSGVLAKRLKKSTRALNKILTQSGLVPVIKGDSARGISTIWRIASLLEAQPIVISRRAPHCGQSNSTRRSIP